MCAKGKLWSVSNLVSCVLCRRNLEYYDTCHYDAIQSCDSDCASSAGELIIKIPKATYDSLGTFGENYLHLLKFCVLPFPYFPCKYMYTVYVWSYVCTLCNSV